MADAFSLPDDLPPLREVIEAHGLRADKALGQNFLLDQNVTDKIARFAGDLAGINVVEIGPGPGGLTRSLLQAGAKSVSAVEFDSRAVGALQALVEAADGRLRVVEADALSVDMATLAEAPRVIVANLPYNIATPLLTGWLGRWAVDPDFLQGMLLMFQKEVAGRITAQVGTKAYGRLTVLCQALCAVRQVYVLPPSAFTPPPKIYSSVVQFRPIKHMLCNDSLSALEALTKAAFGQRRKMIRSSLKDYMGAVEALGFDPTLRAENLSVDDFVALARFVVHGS
jgi:16S rRNA (adenine1518-N6/adenine1519-N6)-dimethyltransferase